MLIIGPTEKGRPSTAYAPAARYAKELRDTGTDIYVINPGYRINEDEGRTIATSVDNVKVSHFRGLNSIQGQLTKRLDDGKKMLQELMLTIINSNYDLVPFCSLLLYSFVT